MPYEAAKALASTFCWTIRYALTPVFGTDFPDMCLPLDHERHGEMLIDPEVTLRCTEEAAMYREQEGRHASRASSAMPSPITPNTPTYSRHIKQLRPKALKVASTNSDYSTDDNREDSFTLSKFSPQPAYRNVWTPANTPRSVPRLNTHLPAPRGILAGLNAETRKRGAPSSPLSSGLSSPELSPKSRRAVEVDEGYDGDSSDESSLEEAILSAGRKRSQTQNADEKAAYLLMSLKLQKTSLGQAAVKSRKRRASA